MVQGRPRDPKGKRALSPRRKPEEGVIVDVLEEAVVRLGQGVSGEDGGSSKRALEE